MSQPEWIEEFCSDHARLRVDTSGVYPPELDVYEEYADFWQKFTVLVEPCFYTDGVLSDNQFHKDSPAWFADELDMVAEFSSTTKEALIAALTSDNPVERSQAYEAIGNYFGFDNFDSYPVRMTEDEVNAEL